MSCFYLFKLTNTIRLLVVNDVAPVFIALALAISNTNSTLTLIRNIKYEGNTT